MLRDRHWRLLASDLLKAGPPHGKEHSPKDNGIHEREAVGDGIEDTEIVAAVWISQVLGRRELTEHEGLDGGLSLMHVAEVEMSEGP